MKSLKPKPTRAGDGGAAPRPPRSGSRRTRTLANASFALVALALLAVVSSTSASLAPPRPGLGGSTSSDRPHLSSTEAGSTRRAGAATNARETSAGATGLDYTLKAAPLFAAFAPQLPGEAVATFEADCVTPKTTFNLGDEVCARATDVVVGGSEFFPIIPLRKFSWVNPAGLQVRSVVISTATQTDTFTIPSDETTTFGDVTVDNRGGWRVVVASLFDSSERASVGFTARKPTAPAVDLSVLATQEQRQERVPAGSQAPFIIVVENKGPDPAANVELRLPVPDFSTFFSLTPPTSPAFTCVNPAVGGGPGGTSVCSLASLAPGESATFTAVYLISGEAPADTAVTAVPTVASATTERHQPDNSSEASYLVSSQPQCVINVPADITVDNDIVSGQPQGGAVVTYGAPTTEGNCGTVTCDPPSGAFFPVGETFVTCSNASQTAIERFRVFVNDTRTPTISCPASFTVQETTPGSGEAVVNYPAPTVSDNDPNVQVTFDPPAGAPLPLGANLVTATVTDASGNTASCTFTVTVTERQGACTITPDVANLPTITAECSAVASVIPTATDSCAGKIGATTDDPRSFDEPGTYTIRWNYTNASGTTVTQNQTVIVTAGSGTLTITGAPNVNVPLTPGAPGCSVVISDLGAVLNTNVGGSCSGVDVTRTVSPDAPDNVYLVGTVYTVVTTATNGSQTASVTQTLKVIDGIAPTVTAPADASYECPGSVPAADPSQAAAADNCGTVTVSVSETTNGGAGSASSPLVITRTFTATDTSGRTASDAQVITVIDDTPPTITAPADVTVNADPVSCAVAAASVALGAPTIADNCPGASAANNAPASFPLGTTTVTWTVTDAVGRTASATQRVTVVDVTAPVISLNGAATMVVECHTSFADPGATASDACDANVPVTAAGLVDVETPGVYTITYTATDDSGNHALPVVRTVNVVDTTAPTITLTGQVITLWPPNHKYQTVNVSQLVAGASDGCDETIGLDDVVIAQVTSDEPDNGQGDGDTSNDIVIAANCKSVQLRAERNGGGNGRVYTITFRVRDASGNERTATAKVTVPKNQGGGAAVDNGPAHTVTSGCP